MDCQASMGKFLTDVTKTAGDVDECSCEEKIAAGQLLIK